MAERVGSIDVLRGISFVGMMLVNTASPDRPNWLKHANANEGITFADTVFPCFLFTAGMTLSKRQSMEYVLKRSALLGGLGVLVNLSRRLIQPASLLEFATYRLPSVLGRIGIAGAVASLDFLLPAGVLPVSLVSIWYLVQGVYSGSASFAPGGALQSADAKLDRAVFGAAHLHNSVIGFDPEGLLGSLLTAPVSILAGMYYRRYRPAVVQLLRSARPLDAFKDISVLLKTGLAVLPFAAHFAHSAYSATGAVPSSKIFWTPPYVLQTSLGFIVLSEALNLTLPLIGTQNSTNPFDRFTSRILGGLQRIGRCSLELYVLSAVLPVFLKHEFIPGRPSVWNWLKVDLLQHIFGLSAQSAGTLVSGLFTLGLATLGPVMENYRLRFR